MNEVVVRPYDRTFSDLFFEDVFFRRVHQSVVVKFPFFETKEAWEAWFSAHEYQKAKGYAARVLSRKGCLSQELKTALEKRLFSKETIEKVILKFETDGALDDSSYLHRFVEKELSRGRGPHLIAQKLRYQKKVPDESIQSLLKHLDVTPSLEKLLKNYTQAELENPKERQKIIGKLHRKGFPLEEIFRLIQPPSSP